MKNGKAKTQKIVGSKDDQLRKQVVEYKNKYLRALADYHNFEKRVRDQQEEQNKKVTKRILLELLPFLDDLEKAEVFLKDEGLKLIMNKFYQVLSKEGLKEMDLLGQEYDPHFAEAVDVVKGDEENKIVDVLRKGYMLGDEILRVAQVRVTKKL